MITSHICVYHQHGEPSEVLKSVSYEIDENKLQTNQVVVKTLGAPVNPSDINQIQGVYPSKPEPTTEFSADPAYVCGNEGLFEVLHSNSSDLSVGDWVIPKNVNFGTWRTHALADAGKFIRVPNPSQSTGERGKASGLTVNQGATISVNPLTAYLMLTQYVKLTPGKDWFIQNAGNSAVGQYASQIGSILGFNSISVVRDRENLDELADTLYKKGATKVITDVQNESREFVGEVKKWTKETGGQIKLALNAVGGKSSTAVARKLAPNGWMLTYGGMSYQPVILPTSLHIFKNVTSTGFWVTELLKNNEELKRETLDKVISWYEEGKLIDAPSVQTKFVSDIAATYKKGIEESKKGKQLIVFE